MGPLNKLYDTNIVIDDLKHIPAAEAELTRDLPNYISIITWIEVMAGVPSHQEENTRDVLAGFVVIPLTPKIANQASVLRRQTRLKLPDAIILATAQQQVRTLVTRNTRDFSATDLRILVPYEL